MRRARFDHGGRLLAFHAASMLLAFEAPTDDAAGYEMVGDTAVVTIRGPLMQHGGPFAFWDDYDSIIARVCEALKSTAKAVVLKTDSPGGDALGCFEASRAMRSAAVASDKPLYAYCDGMICSAAFALACAATGGIFVPEAGIVGSIGVIKERVDVTKRDEAMGLRFESFTSGMAKTYSNPHNAVSDEERESTQAEVDDLAGVFFDLIGEMRGERATRDAIKALNGATLMGANAVKAGLADGVRGWSDFLAMVAAGPSATSTSTATGTNMMNRKEMKAALAEMAGGDGDDAKKARKALALFDEDDEKKDEKKDDAKKAEDKDAPAKDEPKKDEAKSKAADGDGPPNKEDDAEKKDEAKAQASITATVLDLSARLHARDVADAKKADAEERATLLATRPDFTAKIRATLADSAVTSIEAVRIACKEWERVPGFKAASVATPSATRGKAQVSDGEEVGDDLDEDDVAAMDVAMGLKAMGTGVKRNRNTLTLGTMSPAQARAQLEAMQKKGAV